MANAKYELWAINSLQEAGSFRKCMKVAGKMILEDDDWVIYNPKGKPVCGSFGESKGDGTVNLR